MDHLVTLATGSPDYKRDHSPALARSQSMFTGSKVSSCQLIATFSVIYTRRPLLIHTKLEQSHCSRKTAISRKAFVAFEVNQFLVTLFCGNSLKPIYIVSS